MRAPLLTVAGALLWGLALLIRDAGALLPLQPPLAARPAAGWRGSARKRCVSRCSPFAPLDTGSGGGWGGASSRPRWSGGGGDDGGEEGEEIGKVEGGAFSEADLKDLPAAFAEQLAKGMVPADALVKYRKLAASSGIMRFLLKFGPWRVRLLGGRAFLVKVGIEVGNGLVAQIAAELEKRRGRFLQEMDYVIADCFTASFANLAAIWLSVPTLTIAASSAAAGSASALQTFLQNCPSNAFQKVLGTAPYSLSQRLAAIVMPMPQLFAVGFGACAAGYGLTAAMGYARKMLIPGYEPETESAPIFRTSLAIGAFLAIASNLRYQFMAGLVEQRFLDTVFASRPALSSAGSFVVRTSNLYLGAAWIVDWLRFLGLQQSEAAATA